MALVRAKPRKAGPTNRASAPGTAAMALVAEALGTHTAVRAAQIDPEIYIALKWESARDRDRRIAGMDKRVGSPAEAVSGIGDGATVMIGGFGGSGSPIELIHALIDHGPKGLTVVNNNAGNGHVGLAALIEAGLVRKLVCSFPRSADPVVFTGLYLAGRIELELVPQGTLAERIRAGGAGIPAFYTPTSYGTDLARGKPVAEFDGRNYVRERWLKADFALVKAEAGDPLGNLTYRRAARNFGPLMCMAAAETIVQVSRIVAPGAIDPEQVITPGIFVRKLVEVPDPQQEEVLNRQGARYP